MSKPYDATSKDLIEADPAGWVTYLGCRVDPSAVSLVDADVSTVTAEADKVIRVDGPAPWLLHLEIQASRDDSLERRLLRYSALLHHRHDLPVTSVVVLLRQSADHQSLTGQCSIGSPIGPAWAFRYHVLRVWERPTKEFLGGPLGVIPFAPLARVERSELPEVLNRIRDRIGTQADPPLAAKLWTATYLLMGLRYEQSLIDNLLSGVRQMEESVTYQAILERGVQQGINRGRVEGLAQGLQIANQQALDEARKMLLRAAEPKLGSPSPPVIAALEAIHDVTRFETLASRLYASSSWDELLKTNP